MSSMETLSELLKDFQRYCDLGLVCVTLIDVTLRRLIIEDESAVWGLANTAKPILRSLYQRPVKKLLVLGDPAE